jgi:hypothetical protein
MDQPDRSASAKLGDDSQREIRNQIEDDDRDLVLREILKIRA